MIKYTDQKLTYWVNLNTHTNSVLSFKNTTMEWKGVLFHILRSISTLQKGFKCQKQLSLFMAYLHVFMTYLHETRNQTILQMKCIILCIYSGHDRKAFLQCDELAKRYWYHRIQVTQINYTVITPAQRKSSAHLVLRFESAVNMLLDYINK